MKWRIEYLPGDSDAVHEYEGTEAGLDEFFYANCLCGICKAEVDAGVMVAESMDGARVEFPIDSPWQTGCGAEWDLVEIQ